MNLQRDGTLSRTLSVCFPYVSDRSIVTPMYYVQWLLPLVSLQFSGSLFVVQVNRSPLSSLRLGAASSSQNTRSGVRYHDTVYSQCENVFDCVARVQSSAYPNVSVSVGVMSLMQSFQVERPQNREISLFIGEKIGRIFSGTLQGEKTVSNSCYPCTLSIRSAS